MPMKDEKFHFDFEKIGLKAPEKVIFMTTGSASVNCYVKNSDGEFLVKIKDKSTNIDLLSENLNATSGHPFCPELLFEKSLGDKHVFVSKWIDGHNCYLEKLSPQTFLQIITAYMDFLKLINAHVSKHILPAENLTLLLEKIKTPYRFMLPDLRVIREDLSYTPKMQVIHGDFHYKNIVIKNGELRAFLDFECFRYGVPTEDLMRFILTNAEQHRIFRRQYTVKLLKCLIRQTPFTKQDWLYGLDAFILSRFERKLHKKSAKQRLKLYYSTLLYRKLRQVINESD